MTEPTTPNTGLIVPNTGDLPGLWGADAINPDMVALDGFQGGVAVISLASTNVILTGPSGFIATPTTGPTQAQNALLRFTGMLSGNVTVTLPLPGYYIAENRCTVGAFAVTLASTTPGNVVGAPPGRKCHIFNDGTNVDYVDLPEVGSYMDLATATVPAWITACTIPPWLNCAGGTFSAATYPQLAALLGGTTLPDSRGRTRFTLNQGTGNIENNGQGIDGDVIFSVGGQQAFLQANLPGAVIGSVSIPPQWTHAHGGQNGGSFVMNGPYSPFAFNTGGNQGFAGVTASVTNPTLSGSATIAGSGLNYLPPGYVHGLTLIRAG